MNMAAHACICVRLWVLVWRGSAGISTPHAQRYKHPPCTMLHTHMPARPLTHTQPRTHTVAHSHTHSHILAHMHTQSHTQSHTGTQAHTQAWEAGSGLGPMPHMHTIPYHLPPSRSLPPPPCRCVALLRDASAPVTLARVLPARGTHSWPSTLRPPWVPPWSSSAATTDTPSAHPLVSSTKVRHQRFRCVTCCYSLVTVPAHGRPGGKSSSCVRMGESIMPGS